MAASLKYTLHRYGSQNDLQKLGVWEVEGDKKGKYWVVYIHGGAWRDPRVTHEDFTPSIDQILLSTPPPGLTSVNDDDDGSGGATGGIAGFASIDYRLSPHPQFPQDPATTPADQYRGARHPDHLDDVRSALVFLQRTYGFGGNYVLIGHSAGSSLAFQLLATSSPSASASASASTAPAVTDAAIDSTGHPVLPAAIIGLEGLYDFTGVNDRYDGAYAPFFRGAFGAGLDAWDAAAPIKFAGSYAGKWPGGNIVLLGWSPDDTLVDGPEADNMARRLRDLDGFVEEGEGEGEGAMGSRGSVGDKRLILLKDLRGDHDEIWQSGEDVARTVWIALRKLEAGL
ncbi:alpha/beta-hydrolase [Nemania sp. NC0429]|nr:alpha/beta-hydrolase [Nemania sp. NC0429]